MLVKCCSHPAPWLLAVSVLHLTALSVSFVPIVLQVIVRMFSISVSGMPNNACPFPGTAKKLQILCLLLFSIFSLHMPNCVIIAHFLLGYLYSLLPQATL